MLLLADKTRVHCDGFVGCNYFDSDHGGRGSSVNDENEEGGESDGESGGESGGESNEEESDNDDSSEDDQTELVESGDDDGHSGSNDDTV
jgi:hypothetical protein